MTTIKEFIKSLYNSISTKTKVIIILTIILIIFISVISIKYITKERAKDKLYDMYISGTLYDVNKHSKDSLQAIVNFQEIIIKQREHNIDSLKLIKNSKTNYYETTIQNYTNPITISDDSISSYISKKLHNK